MKQRFNIRTSNFARSAKLAGAISIARGQPRFGRRPVSYTQLAPHRQMLKLPREQYVAQFDEILAGLNPLEVARDLVDLAARENADPIMLCWESPNVFCHRRMVAEWLENELGIMVPEISLTREETLAASEMPDKPPRGGFMKAPKLL